MAETFPTPKTLNDESRILRSYWRRNLLLMFVLLVIWASVSLGCGILFADSLNRFHLPGTGYPLDSGSPSRAAL